MRRVGKVCAEDAPCAVFDDEDEGVDFRDGGGCEFIVEGGEADAVFLEAVDQGPGFGELEARGHEEPDLFRQHAGEDYGGRRRVCGIEDQRGEWRWLEGRSGTLRRGVDAIVHIE